MSSPLFNRQLLDLHSRTVAYHSKCSDLWNKPPTAPHYGAPFLFAYVWSTWSEGQRKALVEKARESLEQSISAMMNAGGVGSTNNKDEERMHLLLACCVPEIFQDDLYTQLRPMAELLNTIWRDSSSIQIAAAQKTRPEHAQPDLMKDLDQFTWIWTNQVTMKLIEEVLKEMDYNIFRDPSASSSSALTPAQNELYQRDLLLSLRAFWMSYFSLQIFMNLSESFHLTEEMLWRQEREHNAKKQAEAAEYVTSGPAYKKPIHTMKIEEILNEVEEKRSQAKEAEEVVKATKEKQQKKEEGLKKSNEPRPDATDRIPPAGPPSSYCAFCHASTLTPSNTTTSPSSTTTSTVAPVPIELKRCSRCKSSWYCTIACQKKHFKVHKRSCMENGEVDSRGTMKKKEQEEEKQNETSSMMEVLE